MKKHYETHVEDTDKLISVAGPELDYKAWYEQYRKLMEEQAQRKYGLYTPTSEGDDDFPSIPGITARYSALGLTNEEMSKNPVWVDKTGNGHDLQMKNFAWRGMSGCGGYSLSKKTFSYTPDIYNLNFTDPSVSTKEYDVYFQLIGLDENSGVTFNLDVRESGTAKRIKRETYTKDGIYHFEYKSEDDTARLYMIGYNGVGEDRTTFTVEILPYYPGALVFDGVDDYGICENFPILTKEKGYTVVALRKWLTPENKTNNEILVANLKKPRWVNENWGAFGCEIKYNNTNPKTIRTMSFGNAPVINVNENNVLLCQTSNNYNGVDIVSGNNTSGPYLLICSGGTSFFANAAIWELIILDHDATEEELTKIKNYFIKTYPWLFFDQAWTVTGKTNEDTDRATIANITGNGNNLVLSNFGFAGNSGYGEYAQNFNGYGFGNLKTITYTRTAASMKLDVPAGSSENIYSNANGEAPIGFVYNFNLKITGLKTGNLLSISQGATLDNIIANINQNGVYNIKATVDDSWNQRRIYIWIRNSNGPETTLSIEQIPDHEGYLVTDGVDDIVASSSFELDKKFTVVGEWKFINNESKRAGIVFPAKLYAYNEKENMLVYINTPITGNTLQNIRSFKALTSDGKLYDNNWEERVLKVGDTGLIRNTITFGGFIQNNVFTQIAFKNLGIYNSQTLSKEDMIKAYIYLQTLKAK